jgi:hypothetical protein
MCCVCSRRGLIAGAITIFLLGPTMSRAADRDRQVACGFGDGHNQYRNTMTSKSDDPSFDRALIAELKRILQVIPVDPGFQYVDADNAFALSDSIIANTKGTILIGQKFVKDLVKQKDGGVAVAGVLAHECAHIFQFFTSYYDRLNGRTKVLLELHADFLAGYYMAKRIGFAPDNPGIFAQALIQKSTYRSSGHGTPGQRNAAMDKGYMLSLSGKTFEEAAREGEEYVRRL